MASTKDNPAGLDQDLHKSEETVKKLTKDLKYWRQWKEDYQTLKEDLEILPDSAPGSEFARIRQDFVGDAMDAKELIEIFGKNDSKKRDQILSVLDNRIDYVGKNISTLQKNLEAAQNNIPGTTGVSESDADNEDSFPITEIMEELDDDDNVLSYSLRNPGNSEAQLLQALQKAGINDESSSSSQKAVSGAGKQSSSSSQTESDKAPEKKKKKSVAFSEDTKSTSAESSAPTETAKKVEQIMKSAKEQEDFITNPVIPAYESADDAALREDMIRYNKDTMLYEMAPIVAELNLEEASDIETDEYSDYDDDDDDDDEDQWGRSTKGLVDDDWRIQMEELKERLSNHTFGDNDATDATLDGDENAKAAGLGRIAVRPEQVNSAPVPSSAPESEPSATPADSKKNVRFASNLDIAEEKPTKVPDSSTQQPQHSFVEPLSDVVMERTAPPPKQPGSSSSSKSSKRPSRFKKDRAMGNIPSGPTFQGMPIAQMQSEDDDKSRFAPSGPEGQVLSNTVLEKESSAQAKEPDEFDDDLLRQQVSEEYHKARNKFIHRQGGFLKEDENPIQPLTEEEGGPKKMSRFKAARLAKS